MQAAQVPAGDVVLRAIFLGKGGEGVPCWSSRPRMPLAVATVVLGLYFGVGQLSLPLP